MYMSVIGAGDALYIAVKLAICLPFIGGSPLFKKKKTGRRHAPSVCVYIPLIKAEMILLMAVAWLDSLPC